MQVRPQDLNTAFTLLGGRQNPVKAVGSVFGFSGDEVEAGVPTWAWLLVAAGAGIYLGKVAKEKGLL